MLGRIGTPKYVFVAGIKGPVREIAALRREQFDNVRGPHRGRLRRAEGDVLDRRPGQVDPVLVSAADRRIVRGAPGDFQRKFLGEHNVLENRHTDFAVDVLDVIFATTGSDRIEEQRAGSAEGVLDEKALFLAILNAS